MNEPKVSEMSDKADNLSKQDLIKYGNQALQYYWDALESKPTQTFEEMIDQIYYDHNLNQQFRDEDFPEFGRLVAMYLLDHPYPDKEKLKSEMVKLAEKTPIGKVPSKWGLGQAIVRASEETSWMDYLTISKEAVIDTAKDFKDMAVIAAVGYTSYKIIALIVAAAGTYVAYRALSKKKA